MCLVENGVYNGQWYQNSLHYLFSSWDEVSPHGEVFRECTCTYSERCVCHKSINNLNRCQFQTNYNHNFLDDQNNQGKPNEMLAVKGCLKKQPGDECFNQYYNIIHAGHNISRPRCSYDLNIYQHMTCWSVTVDSDKQKQSDVCSSLKQQLGSLTKTQCELNNIILIDDVNHDKEDDHASSRHNTTGVKLIDDSDDNPGDNEGYGDLYD